MPIFPDYQPVLLTTQKNTGGSIVIAVSAFSRQAARKQGKLGLAIATKGYATTNTGFRHQDDLQGRTNVDHFIKRSSLHLN
jgi:hypothetical protein